MNQDTVMSFEVFKGVKMLIVVFWAVVSNSLKNKTQMLHAASLKEQP
jgi:hypothetical protein